MMLARCNTAIPGYVERGGVASEEYAVRTAKQIMNAIDAMPQHWRQLANAYGYIDVYRAMRAGRDPDTVKAKAEANGGFFVFG